MLPCRKKSAVRRASDRDSAETLALLRNDVSGKALRACHSSNLKRGAGGNVEETNMTVAMLDACRVQ